MVVISRQETNITRLLHKTQEWEVKQRSHQPRREWKLLITIGRVKKKAAMQTLLTSTCSLRSILLFRKYPFSQMRVWNCFLILIRSTRLKMHRLLALQLKSASSLTLAHNLSNIFNHNKPKQALMNLPSQKISQTPLQPTSRIFCRRNHIMISTTKLNSSLREGKVYLLETRNRRNISSNNQQHLKYQ